MVWRSFGVRTLIVLALLLSCAPSWAQESDVIARALQCSREKATAFAKLEGSLSEVAAAATAACDPILDGFRPPNYRAQSRRAVAAAVIELRKRMEKTALATVAEERLKLQPCPTTPNPSPNR